MTTDKALSDQLRATTHRRPSARRRSNHQDLPTGCSTSFGSKAVLVPLIGKGRRACGT